MQSPSSQFPISIAARFKDARITPNGFQARCPAHEDQNASLAISLGEGDRTLIYCHAGCSTEDICSAAGIKMADLFPSPTTSTIRKISETYDYQDEQGVLLYQVLRFIPKDFRQRRPDSLSDDGWTWSTKGVRRVLYRLREVIEAIKIGKPILIAEGEKDVAALVDAGFCATCNAGGAGKWLDEYSETLRGADVVIVPDNDETGRQHAELVASKLNGFARSIKTIKLPTGKDAHDFFVFGGTAEQINDLIDRAGPSATPNPPEKLPDESRVMASCVSIEARSICSLEVPKEDNRAELLKHRFLCREGGLLIAAPTGIGKSVIEMQMAVAWSLGRSCLGIEPAQPLKSVIIQAENDDGDLAEMRDGIFKGLKLSENDIAEVRDRVLVHRESAQTGLQFVNDVVRPLLKKHHPDLVWIDPLFSYLGGDVCDQALVSRFLRNWINPLLIDHKCAAVIIHHTNKPQTGKDKTSWSGGDFAYVGSGSSELANWSRGVLGIRSIGSHDVFSFIAGKRGKRLQWTDADGKPVMEKFIGHSEEPEVIYWRDVDPAEIAEPVIDFRATIISLVPADAEIERAELQQQAQAAGMGRDKTRSTIDDLIDSKELVETKKKASGRRDRVFISRCSKGA